MSTKKCTKCGEVKELNKENFYQYRGRKDGFHTSCKECHKKYYKIRRERIGKETQEEEEVANNKTEIFKNGTRYKVEEMWKSKKKAKDRTKSFTGRVIYQDRRLLTLKNDKGIVETFLKMDFVTKDYTYEELSI